MKFRNLGAACLLLAATYMGLAPTARGQGPDATEKEIERLFPDCEKGAVPPFGALYDIPTFLDLCLCEGPEIYFTAGSRRELQGMRMADFVFAARPMLGQFCRHSGWAREPGGVSGARGSSGRGSSSLGWRRPRRGAPTPLTR